MDMSVMSSQPMVSSQQTASQASSVNKVEGASETAPFQQKLDQYVSQTDGKATAASSTESATEVTVVEEAASTSGETVLSAEELNAMIEALLAEIDQLIDVPMTDENLVTLEDLSAQLAAILQLFTVDKDLLTDLTATNTQINGISINPLVKGETNNELLFKLQEQLLMLQQSLKDGNLKVVQGQEPEQFITQAMNKLSELLDETKKNSRTLMEAMVAADTQSEEQVPVEKVKNVSFEQLKQLAKLGEYALLSSQTGSQLNATNAQTTEAVPVNQLQAMTPLSAQLNEIVANPKGQTQVGTAYTHINQFADSVKTMVLQKFDLSQFTNGLTQARITLTPEHLGSVDIRLSMQNGVLTAVFAAESLMAKDALENQMSALRGALGAQGITVDRMEVTQASFTDDLTFEQQRRQQAETPQDDDANQDDSFEDELEANVLNQELGYGRAVNEMV